MDVRVTREITESIGHSNGEILKLVGGASISKNTAILAALGVNEELSDLFCKVNKSQIKITDQPFAFFEPIFKTETDLNWVKKACGDRTLVKQYEHKFGLEIDRNTSDYVKKLIATANQSVYKTWMKTHQENWKLTPVFLGLDFEYLDYLSKINQTQFLSAADEIIMPIFQLRVKDVEVWKGIAKKGLTDMKVQKEIIKII